MATAEAKRAAVAATKPTMVPTIHRIMRASIKTISDRTRSTSTRRRSLLRPARPQLEIGRVLLRPARPPIRSGQP